jgi:hypothetical protein
MPARPNKGLGWQPVALLRQGEPTLKTPDYMPEEKMIRRAVEALMSALGPVETVRFLTLPRQHRLDSVRRHRQWQEQLEPKAFFDEVFASADQESNS